MEKYETWVEIDMAGLNHNISAIKKRIPPSTGIIGVIKGNAYGHGAVLITKELIRQGITRVAVATLSEGIELYEAGITDCKIHILGSLHPDCAERAVKYNFISTICTIESARALAHHQKHPVVHINLDLGMNRVGCELDRLDSFIHEVEEMGIVVEGLFGHLPDVLDDPIDTDKQIGLFSDATAKYKGKYIRHLSNSPGLFRDVGPSCKIPFDYVRVGGALYGSVKKGLHSDSDNLKRLLTWKAKPTNVQYVRCGEGVGYSSAYLAEEDFWLATLPLGYVDGLSFQLSSTLKKGKVKMGNQYCDIVGKLCMDQLMVRIPEKIGLDTVFEVLTADADEHVGILSRAIMLETTPTDIISDVDRRVARVVLDATP